MEGNKIDTRRDLPASHIPSVNLEMNAGSGTLLYIGNFFEKYIGSSTFKSNVAADNFLQAKRILKTAFNTEKNIPALIVINLPLATADLENFIGFLKKYTRWSGIPIIYHEGALTPDQLNKLSGQQLVDDITDINLFGQELEQKAAFLKKTKRFLNDSTLTENEIPDGNQKNTAFYNPNFIVRRFLNIALAALLLFLLFPLMVLIMILIKIESKGPAIYKSKRAGRGCRIFDFYKFRTMFEGAENKVAEMEEQNLYNRNVGSNKPIFFKALNDDRITKVGRILRNTSLDELPQLINVLKGDMSLVGNRPLPLYEASILTTDLWAELFMAPAGMTGLWQVLKRGKKEVSFEERLSLDISYARDNNIGRDLWILANTPKALFQKADV